jgi:hypothetical protein
VLLSIFVGLLLWLGLLAGGVCLFGALIDGMFADRPPADRDRVKGMVRRMAWIGGGVMTGMILLAAVLWWIRFG